MEFIADKSKRSKFLLNSLTLLVALISFFRSEPQFVGQSSFQTILVRVFAPVQSSIKSGQLKASNLVDHYLLNINASMENRVLKKEVLDLKEDIFSLKELERENERLKLLLDVNVESQSEKILARVVSWDSSSDFQSFRIDRGSEDGVKLQDPVLTSQGLVGYVYRMTSDYSDVLTILDNRNRVDGLVVESRSFGILEGTGGKRCRMKYVSRTSPIETGNVVMTSGLGNIYPKGIKVGIVSKVVREGIGIVQEIEVRPSVDFQNLEEVIVLRDPMANEKKKQRAHLNDSIENDLDGGN